MSAPAPCAGADDFPLPLISRSRHNSLANPAGLAWVDPERGESLTHAQRHALVLRAIAQYRALGIGSGDVVCLILKRSGAFLPALLACIETRSILAPTNPDPRDIEFALKALQPRLIITTDDWSPPPVGLKTTAPVRSAAELFGPFNSLDATDTTPVEPTRTELEEVPALLVRTSGTTGEPKFVELSERSLAWNSRSLALRYNCTARDLFLCTLPWHHMNAIMMTGCVPLTAGGGTHYVNLVLSPDPFAAIVESRATIPSLTPTLLRFLLGFVDAPRTLGAARFVFSGAAPLDGNLWRAFEERFQVPVYQGYGLTETTCWATSTLPGIPHDYQNVGHAMDCQVTLDSSSVGEVATWVGPETERPGGRIGELLISGPLLMCGYRHLDGRRTSPITPRGELRTGDLGVIEEDGLVRVIGRTKEIIIRAGINIVPETVDAVLRTHPAVADCKTVGIPDDRLGERVVTICIAAEGLTPSRAELRRYLVERVSNESLPDETVMIARLPRTAVGKIALGELRKLVSGESAREAFAALNKQRFKRAQPSDPEGAVRTFQSRLLSGQPLSFLTYWGVGRRRELNDVDRSAMESLRRFIDSARCSPNISVELNVLLADVHATINGKPPDRVRAYHGAVRQACEEYGFRCAIQTELWKSAGLDLDRVREEAGTLADRAIPSRFSIAAEAIEGLRQSARRHSETGDPERSLVGYLIACESERQSTARHFAGSVFLTYSPPRLAFLNPTLPTMFLFSYRHGSTAKPWFVDDPPASQSSHAGSQEAERP